MHRKTGCGGARAGYRTGKLQLIARNAGEGRKSRAGTEARAQMDAGGSTRKRKTKGLEGARADVENVF